jgi:predicted nucleic acid-binding protein
MSLRLARRVPGGRCRSTSAPSWWRAWRVRRLRMSSRGRGHESPLRVHVWTLKRSSKPVTPTAGERAVVCDASALVALLLDSGPDGSWVAATIAGATLVAPGLAIWEAANILRRHELAGIVSSDQAAQAHADLLDLAIEFWPYELLSRGAWSLRQNLSIYDASYVALAELLRTALVTLDRRVASTPGVACSVLVP